MSEMEQTADHVLVIGRGHLVADMPMAAFTAQSSQTHVRVVSARSHELAPFLEAAGAAVSNGTPHVLTVTGLDTAAIGAIAFAQGIPLDELSSQQASLEEAFMEMTRDSVEYRAGSGPSRAVTNPRFPTRELAVERTN
jgi:ABC-2 type transport system ATP-binding protein